MLDTTSILSNIQEVRIEELSKLNTTYLSFLERSKWIEALNDLDELHKSVEFSENSPFIGRSYLISYDDSMPYLYIKYILERINTPERWKAIIAISTDEEYCPVKYTDIWEPTYTNSSVSDNSSKNYELCYNCHVPSMCYCNKCGVNICDECSSKNVCHYCIMEYNEF